MPSGDLSGPAAPAGEGQRRRARAVLMAALLAVSLGLVAVGCGNDATLDRQEAQARARTCASLAERHSNTPETVPPWRWFLAGASQKSDTQRTEKARQTQNATQIKADCKAATRGLLRP